MTHTMRIITTAWFFAALSIGALVLALPTPLWAVALSWGFTVPCSAACAVYWRWFA